jgi:hypothetical protein
MINSASLDELYKIVLRHTGSYVSTAVDGKIGTPGKSEVEAYERWFLVAEL